VITRRAIDKIIREIRKLGCTTIFISELMKGSDALSRDTVSEFLVDGVIVLRRALIGEKAHRILAVEKMRGTKQDENIHKFEITDKGFVVL
jgi:KaiC/GvpD/RAD55 family RecA-like ATPase